ncbi:MAG: hypothetical protein IJ740_19010 [Ruminococcus sp.]|nr:hypothetical protein [Ruminococcus sp.]MBR1752933.1 hypothetical protein [Ruminococcus sp.]
MKNKAKKVSRTIIMFVLMCMTAISMAATVSAAGSDTVNVKEPAAAYTFEDPNGGLSSLKAWIDNLGAELKVIAFSISGVCVVALGIIFITGGSQGLQKGRGWAISILVGVAVVSLGVGIISTLQTL